MHLDGIILHRLRQGIPCLLEINTCGAVIDGSYNLTGFDGIADMLFYGFDFTASLKSERERIASLDCSF